MKAILFLSLICVIPITAMHISESLRYDTVAITVENQCTYPITVDFDASKLKDGVDTSSNLFRGFEDPNIVRHTIEAQTTYERYFERLVHYKNGVNNTLSTLRAYIYSNSTPPRYYELQMNPNLEKQKLMVGDTDDDGLVAIIMLPSDTQ